MIISLETGTQKRIIVAEEARPLFTREGKYIFRKENETGQAKLV